MIVGVTSVGEPTQTWFCAVDSFIEWARGEHLELLSSPFMLSRGSLLHSRAKQLKFRCSPVGWTRQELEFLRRFPFFQLLHQPLLTEIRLLAKKKYLLIILKRMFIRDACLLVQVFRFFIYLSFYCTFHFRPFASMSLFCNLHLYEKRKISVD